MITTSVEEVVETNHSSLTAKPRHTNVAETTQSCEPDPIHSIRQLPGHPICGDLDLVAFVVIRKGLWKTALSSKAESSLSGLGLGIDLRSKKYVIAHN